MERRKSGFFFTRSMKTKRPASLSFRWTVSRSKVARNGLGVEARPAGGGQLLQVAAQHRLHEGCRQLHVAVAEQRHQVVLARAEQGVLEVDHHLLARGEDHQVARLVVAVGEPARLRLQRPGDPVEVPVHHRPLGRGEPGALPGLQPPLQEVHQLPVVEVVARRPRPKATQPCRLALGRGPQPRQLVDGRRGRAAPGPRRPGAGSPASRRPGPPGPSAPRPRRRRGWPGPAPPAPRR